MDNEIKEKISLRQEVYKKVIKGREDLWGYCRLRREVKELVREKKLAIWNDVVEKVNVGVEKSVGLLGRRTKGKETSLKSDTGVSVTSTRGTLEVLQRHYKLLGKISVDSDFDVNWKGEVVSKVSSYGSMSESCEDYRLDKKGKIVKCIRKLKNTKTGVNVGEILKYGGSGMVCLLEQLFSVVWQEETVPTQWRV